ncbi:sugar efflux transporter [Actinoplanes derwentensis]|uniref:MFS transporter, SET family, sugar efflux transporter n=1 Tax=Actinoplanes derwentensis TaxID=113562 RepID=A0A1H2CSP9_9ACTN|nr:sugar efflux transporter [Actinoplanes derwentensis]GID85485.1 sugar efflux transporter SetB [Actinoplanes derwentensis]SDT73297.1 MFS transporter, SET family, sugar efflux transporter [Actinoplanes derwentensis]
MKVFSASSRRLLPLSLVFLTSGVATAVVGPFLGLFLSTAVHADPIQTTVFMVVAALSGVTVSSYIGRISDRWPIRRTLLIAAALAGFASSGLTAVIRDYWILLAVTATVTAAAGALYPQSFAYARQVLQHDDPKRAAMGISTLRTVFSVAWVGGPSLAAFLLDVGDFRHVYGAAAILYLAAALGIARFLPALDTPAEPRKTPTAEKAERVPQVLWVILSGFALLQTTMNLNGQALPLYLGTELNGTIRDAGLIFGLCAFLEIPLMLGFGMLSSRIPLRPIILAGTVCSVAYYSVAATASSVWVLAVGQILNAIFIAATSGLGISYVQDMMPRSPGRATTLFTNCFPIGLVMAAPLFGLAQEYGFRLAFAINLGLSVLGLLLLIVARPRVTAPNPALRPVADVTGPTEG